MTQGPDFTNIGQITQRRAAYDTDNMPTQVWASQSGVTTYFSYDGDGDRVKKTTTSGATIYYVGDHYEIKNDESLKYIFAGNLRLIMIKGTNTFYYHKDHLNSTSVMTNNDGTVVETSQYEPFGATRDHTGTDMSGYKFTDQELDNETNLYNYDARLYDSVIGRFGAADTIMSNAYDPQSLNAYAYCRNNPLIYTDPTGHTETGPNDTNIEDAKRACFAEERNRSQKGSNYGGEAIVWLFRLGMGGTEPIVESALNIIGTVDDVASGRTSISDLNNAAIYYSSPQGKAELTKGIAKGIYQKATSGEPNDYGSLLSSGLMLGEGFLSVAPKSLAAESGISDWAKMAGQLQDATKAKGNIGIGSGTMIKANEMGTAWVGSGYKVSSDGTALLSSDLLRQYRPPAYKPRLGVFQANFERRFKISGKWQGNAHLTIGE